jgi:hypothetical protein
MHDRLGWTGAARDSLEHWSGWTRFAAETRADGLDRALICGMGGSSLAPRVLVRSFGVSGVDVLDSTDPAAVRTAEHGHPIGRTLFLIVSKSGSTVETLAAYHYYAARARPDQFVAVTDPGSALERLARERGFRAVFPHPADVGGRYAALTVVGMLPAALAGIDGRTLLERACEIDVGGARTLGGDIATAAVAGRDKLALAPPAPVAALASWIEQLVAESSGKDGTGVVPLIDGQHQAGDDVQQVSEFSPDPLDLGREFLRWEYATWELCERLGVNAFDQPNVEEAKQLARAELATDDGAAAIAPATLTPGALRASARPGDYLAILAYLPPEPVVEAALHRVRQAWGRKLGIVTTIGFGPRYLHSTGQLHKGGPNTGLFLVITADPPEDLDIPELGTTFGRLERAQAMGDIRALLARGRRVCHVHLTGVGDVEQLAAVS